MISYSQNFEDVMLYRALRHVEKGMWIDVGAWHPQLDSVTKWFYDSGWSGINVEPSKNFFRMLERKRPRDINLNIAIGRKQGKSAFFEVDQSGMSSLGENSFELGRRVGYRGSSVQEVNVKTLTEIFDEYAVNREVHFVKIDVEGFEADVLSGLDLRKYRPWILVVEAVEPITNAPSWESWEPGLLESGYQFVWFDGLNRFYLREESKDLSVHFKIPVNIFDEVQKPYIKIALWNLMLKTKEYLPRRIKF